MSLVGMVDSTINYLKTKKSLQTKCIKAECMKFLHWLQENGYRDTEENSEAYDRYYTFLQDNKIIG